ncbi:MAG TPA: iduronate sulfatase [Candidatus Latescibacteria bacterium]|nr:iduronate sulfatase [Candidatus Latescibacterota bacterium]
MQSTHPGQTNDSKINVLFITLDDLRPQLGCYGQDEIHSPNIDALGESGTVFNRAYCQQAVCNPSRASVMTGLRPDSGRVWDLRTHFRDMNPDVVTLFQHFKNNGYHSEGVGKIYHQGHGNRDDPMSWSVPHRVPDISNYALDESNAILQANIEASKARVERGEPAGISNGPASEIADVDDDNYKDGITTDWALEALDRLKDESFFLAVGLVKPHLPFCAPKKYWDLYDPSQITLPENDYLPEDVTEWSATDWGELRKYDNIPAEGPLPEAQARHLIHGYYACVSYIDEQIGKLIDRVKVLGLWENTAIVLWGDHGWKLGEHGLWCKHTNFELDTHSPLIVRVPGQASVGKPSDSLVEFVDIYPTLTEAAGHKQPDHLEGTSLLPLLDNPDRAWKLAAFSQYPRPKNMMGYSMRTDRYRYTEWVDRETGEVGARELYDHVNDPNENANVANRAENKEKVEQLAKMMDEGWEGAKPQVTD